MIKEINNQTTWNQFLLRLNPNTFLQSWEWGQVQKAAGGEVCYLGIFENNEQIGACLTLTVSARRGRHFLIPHGPIFTSEEQTRKYLPELVEYLKNTPEVSRSDSSGVAPAGRSFSEGWKRGSFPIALRIAPLLISSPENLVTFRQLGFRPAPMHVHAELTWVLDINKPEEELLAGMRKTTRQAIQKAQQAGVTVQITTDSQALTRFMPLYEQTKHRHDFVPYSQKTLQAQLEIFGAENRVFAAFTRHNNQDIAAGIFFQFGNTVFYYHGASDLRHAPRSLGGVGQLLQWAAIKEAKRRGATRFNFWGVSPSAKKAPTFAEATAGKSAAMQKHPFDGITTFKTGFGGYLVDYMHAQDLPLSLGYWRLWLIDTYRKFKRGF